jgi:predicted N-acyltransferase
MTASERQRQAAALRVRSYSTLSESQKAAWATLLHPGDFHASVDWCAAAADKLGLHPDYRTVEEPETEAFRVGVPVYRFNADSVFTFQALDHVLRRAGALFSFREAMPSAYFGSLYPARTRLHYAEAGSFEMPMDDLLSVPADVRSVGFLYVDQEDETLRKTLEARSFASFRTGVASRLHLEGESFDSYLSQLSGSWRGVVRRDLRKLTGAGIQLSTEPLTDSLIQEMVPLGRATRRKHGVPDAAAVLLASLAPVRLLGDAVTVSTARDDGVLRGYLVLIRWRNELYARHCGIDYSSKLPIYFGVVFYEPIRHALAHGVTTIDFGIEAEEVKRSRGCTQTRQYAYVRGLDDDLQARFVQFADDVAVDT